MERAPLPPVDPGEFSLDANRMVAREDGLVVPDYIEEQREKRESTCFCGLPAVEVFRGWGLCQLCAKPTKRRWRRMNRKQPTMATSIKTR